MIARIAKKRALQKAGFVHVAGWVKAEAAPAIVAQIEATLPDVQSVLAGAGE